jgi:uncharacterized membrane protein
MTGTGYLLMKTLHVLAVVVFLGNIIIGAFWKLRADRSGDPRIVAHTMTALISADRWFTMPAAILLVVFGFGAAGTGRLSLGSPWITWSIVLIAISGLVFMVKLAPLQRKLLAVARAALDDGAFDSAAYARLSSSWALWGSVATIAPLIAVVLMIFKPA